MDANRHTQLRLFTMCTLPLATRATLATVSSSAFACRHDNFAFTSRAVPNLASHYHCHMLSWERAERHAATMEGQCKIVVQGVQLHPPRRSKLKATQHATAVHPQALSRPSPLPPISPQRCQDKARSPQVLHGRHQPQPQSQALMVTGVQVVSQLPSRQPLPAMLLLVP